MADLIRYDLLTQQALRGVVRSVLSDAAKKGLPGDHHFFITFDTGADGVRISDRLRTQYPDEMTIILQHQFWHLTVSEKAFDVDLTFGGIMEKLSIPFEAINGFFDPSVQFGLQFEEVTEGQDGKGRQTAANVFDKAQGKVQDRVPDKADDKSPKRKRTPAAATLEAVTPPLTAVPDPKPDRPRSGGGEVVRLDRFRKK